MKRIILATAFLIALSAIVSSFKPVTTAPKIYPEIEAYFKSIEGQNLTSEHRKALEIIKSDIFSSRLDYEDWNLVFYCSENSFRSQASQVFAQTLCYFNKHRKMKIFSAGLTSKEIDLKLISYLVKIGYKITKENHGGKLIYSVRYSDNADPILLFSKTVEDKSLPTKDATSVIVCSPQIESDCKGIEMASNALNLPFPKDRKSVV